MIPTLVRCSKASRHALTPKRGNKDFYKGTRQAYLPHSIRTGAPGKHGKHGGYRIIDKQVRVFVAPPIEEINGSKLKPYVPFNFELTEEQKQDVFPNLPRGGINGEHYLSLIRNEQNEAVNDALTESPGPSTH